MDSPQSVVSPLKSLSVTESEKQNTKISEESKKEAIDDVEENVVGVLEVFIHQARDIHNICIYQKQDVYAKLYLTTHPQTAVSTGIINGGGRNPVFDERLRLEVRDFDSSLKCEVWMLSRVRNYLEDQLLGFALVPVSEILLNDGKLEKEFPLSSTDLFHSPAGFVRLSVAFLGEPPEVIPIPAAASCDSVSESRLGEMESIEFPDPNVVNENNDMVREYLESKVGSDDEKRVDSEQSSPRECHHSGGASTNGASFDPESQKIVNEHVSCHEEHEHASSHGEILKEKGNGDTIGNKSNNPVVGLKIESEAKAVVQQEIVEMYMKSMQEFTESLAKMKLPMDFDGGPNTSGDSSSDQKSNESKNSSGSRVFYGSRAFF